MATSCARSAATPSRPPPTAHPAATGLTHPGRTGAWSSRHALVGLVAEPYPSAVRLARKQLDEIVAECTMALHSSGRRVSDWVPYTDGVIVLPMRKAGTQFNRLILTKGPGTRMLSVKCPHVHLPRATPAADRRIVIADVFGAELDRMLSVAAVKRARPSG